VKSDNYPWEHHRRFNSYTEYIRKTFNGRIQKVVVDAGFTCPNRDGTKGTGVAATAITTLLIHPIAILKNLLHFKSQRV